MLSVLFRPLRPRRAVRARASRGSTAVNICVICCIFPGHVYVQMYIHCMPLRRIHIIHTVIHRFGGVKRRLCGVLASYPQFGGACIKQSTDFGLWMSYLHHNLRANMTGKRSDFQNSVTICAESPRLQGFPPPFSPRREPDCMNKSCDLLQNYCMPMRLSAARGAA